MLTLFNSLGKKYETFKPVNRKVVTFFNCGPSVYQRSHIGNFRTFLFEDILVRYLEFSGYRVKRGMNVTDVEDKAIKEAEARKKTVKDLTKTNIRRFIQEMRLLKMQLPDYLLKASEAVDEAVKITEHLLRLKIAYWHRGNVYFDPLKFPGFGELFGLDMTRWPSRKKRFHRDTYPGMQWNLGDFILWHGCKDEETTCWDTRIGRGRPSWNIQDPSMMSKHFHETLSIYCGGHDNLFRHHDYSRAILESIRPYPMARFWLHSHHLHVNGQKMSKSKGNIFYTEDILRKGYTVSELRFFLIYGHYRKKLNYSHESMRSAAERLQDFKKTVADIGRVAKRASSPDAKAIREIKTVFSRSMDDDLNVKAAFDQLVHTLSEVDPKDLTPARARGLIKGLKEIDTVLQVIF
jgi:cysteinyl-tRNA synthetase